MIKKKKVCQHQKRKESTRIYFGKRRGTLLEASMYCKKRITLPNMKKSVQKNNNNKTIYIEAACDNFKDRGSIKRISFSEITQRLVLV